CEDAAAAAGGARTGIARHDQAVPQRSAGVLGDWQERGDPRTAEGAGSRIHVPDHAERHTAGVLRANQERDVPGVCRAAKRRGGQAGAAAQCGRGRSVRHGRCSAWVAVLPGQDAHAVGVQVRGSRVPAQLHERRRRAAQDLARG
ncbi:hypothetical protein H4S06_006291, partial [Coemansia sp. BCRC 34490]